MEQHADKRIRYHVYLPLLNSTALRGMLALISVTETVPVSAIAMRISASKSRSVWASPHPSMYLNVKCGNRRRASSP
jgi:hypothetical protein